MNQAPPPSPASRGSTGPAAVANSRAAAREKADPVHRAGTGILPMGAFFIGAAILLFAGAYVGDLGGGFRADQFTKLGYVPQPPPGMPLQPAVTDWLNQVHLPRGKKKYALCAACHGPNGEGMAASGYPPLAGSEWATTNTEKFAMIVLNGLQGPITVKGKPYQNVMPSQAPGMTANDLAAVMTYVRKSFGNDASIVTPEMAQKALDLFKARQAAGKGAVTAAELLAEHDKMLPGAEVDPKTGKPPAPGSQPAPGTAPAAAPGAAPAPAAPAAPVAPAANT